jgi:hypothetical protein
LKSVTTHIEVSLYDEEGGARVANTAHVQSLLYIGGTAADSPEQLQLIITSCVEKIAEELHSGAHNMAHQLVAEAMAVPTSPPN